MILMIMLCLNTAIIKFRLWQRLEKRDEMKHNLACVYKSQRREIFEAQVKWFPYGVVWISCFYYKRL